VAACVSGCGVCSGCRAACDWVAHCTPLITHTTTWNTCCHNTAKLIMMCFYWLILQKFNFSQAQCKLPEDGPGGLKHVVANVRYFKLNFNIFMFNKRCPCSSETIDKKIIIEGEKKSDKQFCIMILSLKWWEYEIVVGLLALKGLFNNLACLMWCPDSLSFYHLLHFS